VGQTRSEGERIKTCLNFEVSKNAALLCLGTQINARDTLHLIIRLSRCGSSESSYRMNFFIKIDCFC